VIFRGLGVFELYSSVRLVHAQDTSFFHFWVSCNSLYTNTYSFMGQQLQAIDKFHPSLLEGIVADDPHTSDQAVR
jgi:hypothetical protein